MMNISQLLPKREVMRNTEKLTFRICGYDKWDNSEYNIKYIRAWSKEDAIRYYEITVDHCFEDELYVTPVKIEDLQY